MTATIIIWQHIVNILYQHICGIILTCRVDYGFNSVTRFNKNYSVLRDENSLSVFAFYGKLLYIKSLPEKKFVVASVLLGNHHIVTVRFDIVKVCVGHMNKRTGEFLYTVNYPFPKAYEHMLAKGFNLAVLVKSGKAVFKQYNQGIKSQRKDIRMNIRNRDVKLAFAVGESGDELFLATYNMTFQRSVPGHIVIEKLRKAYLVVGVVIFQNTDAFLCNFVCHFIKTRGTKPLYSYLGKVVLGISS